MLKWRIAADFSAQLPALYDGAFRNTVGKRYDEIEQEIWMEVAKTASGYRKGPLPAGWHCAGSCRDDAHRDGFSLWPGIQERDAGSLRKTGRSSLSNTVLCSRRLIIRVPMANRTFRKVHGVNPEDHSPTQQGFLGKVCPDYVCG